MVSGKLILSQERNWFHISNEYILGLLASDGYIKVCKKKNGGANYYAQIEVKDEQIIKDLAEYYSVCYGHRSRIIANKQRDFYSINIPKNIWSDNISCFMKGRPGLYKVYKNLEDKNSFIRGVFDGDGTVAEMSNSKTLLRIGFSINSSCNDIKMILEDFCQSNDIKLGFYFDKRGSGLLL